MSKLVFKRNEFNSPINNVLTMHSEIPAAIDEELKKLIMHRNQEAVIIIEVLPL